MAIDIKQTSARLHLEKPMMREDCFFIDRYSSDRRKEFNVLNFKFTNANNGTIKTNLSLVAGVSISYDIMLYSRYQSSLTLKIRST